MLYKKSAIAVFFCAGILLLSGSLIIRPENRLPCRSLPVKTDIDTDPSGANTWHDSEYGKEESAVESAADSAEDFECRGFQPQPTPENLSLEEALKHIRDVIKPPEYPVINNKNPLYMVYDFNADDADEICVLCVESEKPGCARKEYLSDFSRLYSSVKENFRFFLYIFSINRRELTTETRIDLGEHTVYKSMTKFSLCRDKPDPLSIAVSFHTTEGRVQKWVIFRRPGFKPISAIVLKDTFSGKTQIEDIDADGIIDIVLFDQVMEEGIGYETFLTWKKWNGSAFIDFKSANIVRNLNGFLSRFRELSLSGKKSDIIASCLDPAEKKKYLSKGLNDEEILLVFFNLPHYSGDATAHGNGPGIRLFSGLEDIVLPEILDNPFYLKDEKGFYFRLSFRMVYTGGVFIIPEVLVYMLKNPFGKMQFVLMPIVPASDSDEKQD